MIEQDRILLTRAGQVNRSLGGIVVEAMSRQHDGELPAQPLREIGEVLRKLGEDMIARADEIDPLPAIEVTTDA